MSAVQLFHQDGKPSGVWYCDLCRSVYLDELTAENCHSNGVCACGKPTLNRFFRQCAECDSRDWKERMAREEAERFEKAIKIHAADWKGDQVYWKDEYFSSIEDLIESCDSDLIDGTPLPTYVWAAVNQGVPKADLEDFLDRVVQGMWDDADYDDLNGVDELQAAVDAFNKANEGVAVYMVDFSTAILLDGIPVKSISEESD